MFLVARKESDKSYKYHISDRKYVDISKISILQ